MSKTHKDSPRYTNDQNRVEKFARKRLIRERENKRFKKYKYDYDQEDYYFDMYEPVQGDVGKIHISEHS